MRSAQGVRIVTDQGMTAGRKMRPCRRAHWWRYSLPDLAVPNLSSSDMISSGSGRRSSSIGFGWWVRSACHFELRPSNWRGPYRQTLFENLVHSCLLAGFRAHRTAVVCAEHHAGHSARHDRHQFPRLPRRRNRS